MTENLAARSGERRTARRRILFGCFEVPGWGGLTTATYRLFETLLTDGFDVHYLNLVRDEDGGTFRRWFGLRCGNPKSLPNVHECTLLRPLHEPHPELRVMVEALRPDVTVGVGSIAAYLMTRATPERPLLFLTTGCMQVPVDRPLTAQCSLLNGHRDILPIVDFKEHEAVLAASRIVAHSDVTRALYNRFYPAEARKISDEVVWFAEWIHQDAATHADLARPFDRREIGVLFVANTWSREEKNYPWVRALADRLDGVSVHVVGEVPERFAGATFHGVVGERRKLFDLMGRARVVASPSLFDTAPGILFEGAALGCNLVASRNCGNWFLCHEALVAEPFTLDAFAKRITLAQTRRFPDNMPRFFAFDSYRRFARMLLES